MNRYLGIYITLNEKHKLYNMSEFFLNKFIIINEFWPGFRLQFNWFNSQAIVVKLIIQFIMLSTCSCDILVKR